MKNYVCLRFVIHESKGVMSPSLFKHIMLILIRKNSRDQSVSDIGVFKITLNQDTKYIKAALTIAP